VCGIEQPDDRRTVIVPTDDYVLQTAPDLIPSDGFPTRRFPLQNLRLAILTACLLCSPTATSAQELTELSLKAAFVHNFVKFTRWPVNSLPQAAPLTACVLGDAALGDALEGYVKGHPVDGHTVVVSRIAGDGKAQSCNLLYLSGVTAKQAATIVAGLNAAPVLTLSDVDLFARSGGMVELYVEGGKMRFRINLENTTRSGLEFSSRLLALATLVKDSPDAAR
jgi:hypothetical protein